MNIYTITLPSPFCTVCKKAGKSSKEYTSHFVKDKPGPDGKVVCPLLLKQKCGYCKENGHTPKFCKKLKERDERKKYKSSRSPFCAVCQDAGLPESEYTSHFVKDQPGPHGKVVCPFLLGQKCEYCNETGHTPSQCHKLQLKKMKDSLQKKMSIPRPRVKAPPEEFRNIRPIEDFHYAKRVEAFTISFQNIREEESVAITPEADKMFKYFNNHNETYTVVNAISSSDDEDILSPPSPTFDINHRPILQRYRAEWGIRNH